MISLTVLRRALVITGRVLAVLLCLLSLSVCAATAVLWVRGAFVVDVVEIPRFAATPTHSDSGTCRLSSGRGVLALNVQLERTTWDGRRQVSGLSTQRRTTHETMRPDQFRLRGDTFWQRLGFNAHSWHGPFAMVFSSHGDGGRMERQNSEWGFRVPYWLIVPLTGVLPLLFLRRLLTLRRWYRTRRGLCGGCGYDLRASTGRCPECGEAIEDRAAATGVPA
jgi:hypothetical protein